MNTKSSSLRRVVMASLMILFVSLFTGQITAGAKQDKGNQQNHTQGKTDKSGKNNKNDWDNQDFKALDKAVDKAADQIFDPGISVSFARNLALEHNLTGYQALPPGIQKNLLLGKPLPPGIAKKMVPGPMLKDLPYHPGYQWRIAGSDLILVALESDIVSDVLHEVFK